MLKLGFCSAHDGRPHCGCTIGVGAHTRTHGGFCGACSHAGGARAGAGAFTRASVRACSRAGDTGAGTGARGACRRADGDWDGGRGRNGASQVHVEYTVAVNLQKDARLRGPK